MSRRREQRVPAGPEPHRPRGRGRAIGSALLRDARFSLRALRRSPGYTAAAVSILALGIGANTAMFSVVDGVLFKALPFQEDRELVLVQQLAPGSGVEDAGVSIPELEQLRARLRSVHDLMEYHSMSFTLLSQGEPDRVDTGVVSANFFSMLGIPPLHGRTFIAGDDDLGAEPVLMLSHDYWMQKFGGDPGVIGRTLEMNDRAHTVVGVLPAYPQYPRPNDVYMPTSACPFRAAAALDVSQGHRSFAMLHVLGRLAPRASVERATGEVAAVAGSFAQAHAQDYQRLAGFTGRAQPLQEELVADARPMLLALTATAVLVLIIACANVANLMLGRAIRRDRELAVRAALGAGSGGLTRLLLTEGIILALAGGAVGLAFGWISLDLLTGFVSRFTPRTGQIGIDGNVLAFTLVASAITGVLAAVAPAMLARRSLAQALRDGTASAGEGVHRQRLRATLVVAQVAVSFALVVSAGLMLKSLYALSAVPLGYDTDRVVTASIYGNFSRMSSTEDALRIQFGVLERLRASPGVHAAAITNAVPQSDIQPAPRRIRIEGRQAADGRPFEVDGNVVSDGYFETLGVPLLAGRDVRATDTRDTPPVAVINRSMAAFWDDANPVGSRFAPDDGQVDPTWITVVGVVNDFRLYDVDRPLAAEAYIPLGQAGFAGRILARTDADADAAVAAQTIRAAVRDVDSEIPVDDIRSLAQLRNERLAAPRLTSVLLSAFAAVALLVTLVGIAGLIGTSVSQRTRELGLRMALGATRRSVLELVLRQGLVLVAAGLVLGLAAALAFGRLIARFLFETTPADATVIAAVILVFLAGALAATLGPARRATAVDPLIALKAE